MDKQAIAAHKIADALDTIRQALNDLDAAASANLGNWIVDLGNGEKLEWTALSVRACAPFEPVPEAQVQCLAEDAIDMYSDMRVKEYVEDLLPQTDWEWRQAADDHRATIVFDLEHADDDADREYVQGELASWDALGEAK